MSEALNTSPIKALVVDDSAVARKVLTSILHREGIEVDMAVSAEDALDFLATHTPDLIFMDHAMPGMSGFEALKAIKANPRTATIPVMMFTSQSGDVYLSQARALGAIDVLQKDSLAEIDLSSRLQELGIFKQQVKKRKATIPVRESQNSARQRQLATLIRLLVREEMVRFKEELPALLKQQVQDQQHTSTDPESALEEAPDWPPSNEPPKSRSTLGGLGGWLLMGALGLLLTGWLLLQDKPKPLDNPTIELAESRNPEIQVPSAETPSIPTVENSDDSNIDPKLLSLISWALGDQMSYGPTEVPLSGERFNRIQTLMTMLADAGFLGLVQLTVHQGQFCVETSSNGELQLATADIPAAECGLLGIDTNNGNANLMSLPFTNFMQNSPVANGQQGIQLEVQSASADSVLSPYPDRSNGISAAKWNAIAQQNNRITLELIPE